MFNNAKETVQALAAMLRKPEPQFHIPKNSYRLTADGTAKKKVIMTDEYLILYNMATGREVMTGRDGNPDPFILEYPNMLDVGIMGHCLNKCEFCYQGDKHEPNMLLDDFKKIVDESQPYVNQIALGGRGDPNHHEDFNQILKYAAEHDIVCNYTTSGIDLTFDQIMSTKQYCGAVAVSNYDQTHTYEAINRFIEAGVKTNIHFVLSEKNFHIAMDILKGEYVWEQRFPVDKLNAVVFLLFKPQGKGANLQDWIVTKEHLAMFAEQIKEPRCNFKVGMDSCLVNKVMASRELSEIEKMSLDTCEGSRMSSYITPDMKLMPCSFGNHDEWGISIKEKSIKEVWNASERFVHFRNILQDKPNTCPFFMERESSEESAGDTTNET